MLVEAQVRDRPLQSGILISELLELPLLRNPKPLERVLPPVKGLIRNPQLPADLRDLCPVLLCFTAKTICSSLCPFLGISASLAGLP